MENQYYVLEVDSPNKKDSSYIEWKETIDSIAINQGLIPVKESNSDKIRNPFYLAKGLTCAEIFRNTAIKSGLATKIPIIISDGKGNLSYF